MTVTTESGPRPSKPPSPATVIGGRAAVIAVVVVLVADFMDLLDATIVSVAAPDVMRDLGAGESALQWTVAGYTLAMGATLITGGRVGDQFGRRRAFLVGLAGFAIASALCALAPNPGFLIATRVLQGLAGGLMVPQVFGVIRSSLAPGARAKALGAYGAVLSLASVAGPLLGGFLVDADLFGLGWRAIFWVNVPIAAIGIVLGARFLPDSRSGERTRLDLLGAALGAVAAVLILLPLIQGPEWDWPWWSFAMITAGIACGAAFLGWERRVAAHGRRPVFDPALLRVRAFSGGLAASALFFGAIAAFFLLFAMYLQIGTGRTALETGLVILPYAIGALVTSGIGVQFATKAGRALLIGGSLVLAASQLLLMFIVRADPDPGYWLLALPLFIGGLGLGLTSPSLINVILAGVPGRDAGSAGAVLTTVSQIGSATGVALLGAIFFETLDDAFALGAAGLDGYGDAFLAIMPWQIGFYVAAAALMLLLPKRAASGA
ncbi:MFS transporter [Glycomyces buryatensis]|uniref:MFS transporter n=1 Tax=Glycomyces buryatensis TaxID=2570927 RepID=A0A4S8QD95_9ACTN|nr:MFS transporter [Glycomyces buryatensis]THV40865.1 MFS transporter [Glycomyces buryatensis]